MSRPRFSARVILPLAHIGITAETLDELENRIETARKLPNEEVDRRKVNIGTQSQNRSLRNCFEWGRDLQKRMIWAFGKTSPEMALFPVRSLQVGQMSESHMREVMPILIELATTHHQKLAAFGQTAAIRDQGQVLLDQLRETRERQELQKNGKRSGRRQRHKELYAIYETVNNVHMLG